MLPWSKEKMKEYVIGETYHYICLICDRVDPITKEITHAAGIYELASSFLYEGMRPAMKIIDGTILDSTFCELVSDNDYLFKNFKNIKGYYRV
jgi:hypothetical protein